MIKFSISMALLILSVNAFATKEANCNKKNLGPACQQICKACVKQGFVVGGASDGDGFWAQCVRPIMTGTAEPEKAVKAGHTLPPAPEGGWGPIASQCQASNPRWMEKGHSKQN